MVPRKNPWQETFDLFHDDFEGKNFMNTDIAEVDGKYVMEVDLPGIDKKDIQIDYDNGYITIGVEHTDETSEERNYIRKERYYGSFQRSFYVGEIDEDNIKAKYEDGILIVSLPKMEIEESAKRRIEIE